MTLSRYLRSRRGVVLGAIAAAGVGLSTYLGTATTEDESTTEAATERDGGGENDLDRPATEGDDDRELPPAQHERLCRCPSCTGGLDPPGE